MDIQNLAFISYTYGICLLKISLDVCLVPHQLTLIHQIDQLRAWLRPAGLLFDSTQPNPQSWESTGLINRWVWGDWKLCIEIIPNVSEWFVSDDGYRSNPCFKPTWVHLGIVQLNVLDLQVLHSKIPAIRFDIIPAYVADIPSPNRRWNTSQVIKWSKKVHLLQFPQIPESYIINNEITIEYDFFSQWCDRLRSFPNVCERQDAKDRFTNSRSKVGIEANEGFVSSKKCQKGKHLKTHAGHVVCSGFETRCM